MADPSSTPLAYVKALAYHGLTFEKAKSAINTQHPWPYKDAVIKQWLAGEIVPSLVLRLTLDNAAPLPLEDSKKFIWGFGHELSEALHKKAETLCNAAKQGEVEAVRAALAGGVVIDTPDQHGLPALAHAVLQNNVTIARLLFDHGAMPMDSTKHEHITNCWIAALQTGRAEWIQLFLEAGTNPNEFTGPGQTPLEILAGSEADDAKALEVLHQHTRCTLSEFISPLSVAAQANNVQCLRYILKQGANPDSKGKQPLTPLQTAAKHGHRESVKALLEFQTPMMTGNFWGNTALHYAAMEGHLEIAELLIKAGADPHKKNRTKKTAAHYLPEQLLKALGKGGPSWYDPDEQHMLFIYSKAFAFGFDPRRRDSPIIFGSDYDGLMTVNARFLERDWVRHQLIKFDFEWFYDFADKLKRGEDFTLQELKKSARANGYKPFTRSDIH